MRTGRDDLQAAPTNDATSSVNGDVAMSNSSKATTNGTMSARRPNSRLMSGWLSLDD